MVFRVARWTATVVLCGVIALCGFKIWEATGQYRQESALHEELLAYKPGRVTVTSSVPDAIPEATYAANAAAGSADASEKKPQESGSLRANQSIFDLRERCADAMGWITVPGTDIDYPFVRAEDNSYYLHRDIDGNYAAAGTLFMDYRCNPQFLGFNMLIYGHNMKNGSMFGTLRRFDDAAFFEEHPTATIFLDYRTYTLEIFAYMVATSNNAMIYDSCNLVEDAREDYFNYLAENAQQYRDIGLTQNDRIVTLSTCAYEFNDARMVLLARLVEG